MSSTTPRSDGEDPLRAELLPGERLFWTGRPDPRVLFTGADLFLVPFSVLWCGFAIFWFVSALKTAGPGFASFGLLFVVVGLYFVAGRFLYKVHRKRRTVYGVTDRRVLIATGRGSIVQTPVRGQPMTTRRRDGHVSVVIGTAPRMQQAAYANTGLDLLSRDTGSIGLWDVDDADPLLAALRRAQAPG